MIDHAVMGAFFRELGKIAAAPPRLKGAQLVEHIEGMIGTARAAANTAREAFESHLQTLDKPTRLKHNLGKLDASHELYSHPTYKAHQDAITHLKTQEAEAAKLGRGQAAEMNKIEVEAPKVEAPKVEAPKVEAPKVEAPAKAPAPAPKPSFFQRNVGTLAAGTGIAALGGAGYAAARMNNRPTT